MATFLALGIAPAEAAQRSAPKPSLQLRPCHMPDIKEEVRCGIYRVPENRQKPNSRVLSLRVVVLPARVRSPSSDPIFLFEGGPGEPATAGASYYADQWIREHNDVVLIDQRGTGEGNRLDCQLPGSDTDLQGYLELPYEAHRKCAETLGRRYDLTQYTTAVAVQDADEIRQALGYKKINVYGASYGSRVAMVYARMFPKNTRTAHLEAAFPFSILGPLYAARSLQNAFDTRLAECAADVECHEAFPDPKGDFEAIRDRLRRSSARVRVTNPASGKETEVLLTEWAFLNGLRLKLYNREDPKHLPSLLRKAREGDFREITEDNIKVVRHGRSAIAWGMNMAVLCNEEVARIRPEEVAKETAGTFLGDTQIKGHLYYCSAMPRATYPANFFAPTPSSVPALIISGKFDPVTPPRFGEETQSLFPNSVHVIVLEAHQFSLEGCLKKISQDFVAKGSVKGLDLSCTAKDPLLEFS